MTCSIARATLVSSGLMASALMLCSCATTVKIQHADGTLTEIRKGAFDKMTVPSAPPIEIDMSPVAGKTITDCFASVGDNLKQYALDKAAEASKPEK